VIKTKPSTKLWNSCVFSSYW